MLRCFLRNQNPHVKDGIFFHDISSRNKMQQVHILHRERKKEKRTKWYNTLLCCGSQRIAGSLYLLKIFSISVITSGGKGRSVVRKASMSSLSCSTEVAPMIELVINGRSRAKPSASWTGVRPCFLANSRYSIVASWNSVVTSRTAAFSWLWH